MNKELIRSFSTDFQNIVNNNRAKNVFVSSLEVGQKEITYGELDDLINRTINLYKEIGLIPGNTVCAFIQNSVEALVAFLAAAQYGLVYAPFPCIATKREVENWVNLVKPDLSLTSNLINQEIHAVLEKSYIKSKHIETNLEFSWLPKSIEKNNSGDLSLKGKLYLSTSGTTGAPKAIVIDIDKLWSAGVAFVEYHKITKIFPRFWNFLPMSYLGGLFNLCLIPIAAEGSVFVDDSFSGKTILSFWQTVDRFDINSLWFSPSIAQGLLSLAERTKQNLSDKYSSVIKVAFIGMSPVKLQTKNRWKEVFGFDLLENFALSETTFFTSENLDNLSKRNEGSVGSVLPYTEVKLKPIDYNYDDSEQVKGIFVKSPFLFDGYLSADQKIVLELDEQGYFSTNDIGELDSEGTLTIKGRARDIIKKGGFFVSLREIEVLVEKHPLVKEAAAVPVMHDFYGENFDLYLILNEDNNQSIISEINRFIHENLIKYKWPGSLFICEDFPRTASGKIKKHLLGGTTS